MKHKESKLTSAGGVVHRMEAKTTEIVLCGRIDPLTWGLPKGTPNQGETLEETAIREVSEETGLIVAIESTIDAIEYHFSDPLGSYRYHKTVHFYMMKAIGGCLDNHDSEFDRVKWFTSESALKELTYDNEKGIILKSLALLSSKEQLAQ